MARVSDRAPRLGEKEGVPHRRGQYAPCQGRKIFQNYFVNNNSIFSKSPYILSSISTRKWFITLRCHKYNDLAGTTEPPLVFARSGSDRYCLHSGFSGKYVTKRNLGASVTRSGHGIVAAHHVLMRSNNLSGKPGRPEPPSLVPSATVLIRLFASSIRSRMV
jgi:hypothetical protein